MAGALETGLDLLPDTLPVPEDLDATGGVAFFGAAFGVGLAFALSFDEAAFAFDAAGLALGLPVDFSGFLVVFFAMNECETDT
ncbi:MAG: hypothetical protein IM638_17310 [Bacteroidetes bacterium]|nr:hypothetical protein [Bacteroidota bacterium]